MCLAETDAVLLPQFLQLQRMLFPDIRTPDSFPRGHLKKAPVYGIKARFRKEADGTGRTVFRSTLLAPDRRMLAGSGIPELTREIATILKLEGYEETAE